MIIIPAEFIFNFLIICWFIEKLHHLSNIDNLVYMYNCIYIECVQTNTYII